jgi:hypothetical protein
MTNQAGGCLQALAIVAQVIMRLALCLGMLMGVTHGWLVSEGHGSDWLTINPERTMTFPGLNRSFGSESFSAFP